MMYCNLAFRNILAGTYIHMPGETSALQSHMLQNPCHVRLPFLDMSLYRRNSTLRPLNEENWQCEQQRLTHQCRGAQYRQHTHADVLLGTNVYQLINKQTLLEDWVSSACSCRDYVVQFDSLVRVSDTLLQANKVLNAWGEFAGAEIIFCCRSYVGSCGLALTSGEFESCLSERTSAPWIFSCLICDA